MSPQQTTSLPEGRPHNGYLYVVSFLLFFAILTGVVFFVLYIAVPRSSDTTWYLVLGMFLVAVPWLFWTATCLYNNFIPSLSSSDGPVPIRPPFAVPPATAPPASAIDVVLVDLAAERERLQFTNITMMDSAQEVAGGGVGDGGGCALAATNGIREWNDAACHSSYRSLEDGSLTLHGGENRA